MPYIRFSRDRRGYEHTFIVHASKRRGKKDARLLYWFRTPPNVKVGRAPIDEEAIRAIEQNNPDLTFDWARILEARPVPAAEPAPARGKARARQRREEAERAPGVVRARVPREERGEPEEPEVREAAEAPMEATPPEAQPVDLVQVLDIGQATEPPVVPESARPVPAEELVGAEGLARLRALYAELQARITERGGEPARVDELRREAERLNPDAWVTLDEARQALEQYEVVSETFRRALGRRRRSRRGGARRRRRGGAGPTAQAAAGSDDSQDDPE